jgi:hypothetical protein
MEANRQPYPRAERKHGKFVILKQKQEPEKLSVKQRFINWIKRKPTPIKVETLYLQMNNDRTEYAWSNQIGKSYPFAFDDACKVARQVPEDNLHIKLIKHNGKQFFTV